MHSVNPDVLKLWLNGKKNRVITKHYVLAALSLVGGVVITLLTFLFAYFMVLIVSVGFSSVFEAITGKQYALGHWGRLSIAIFFMTMLFARSVKAASTDLRLFQRQEFEMDERLKSNFGDHAPFVEILSRPRASSNLIAEVLSIGPRLVVGVWSRIGEASRLGRLDEAGCADILALLCSRTDDVSYEELCATGWGNRLSQLKQIDGVCFLKDGLLLSEELKSELKALPALPCE
jgi:hypothetical protein